MTPANGPLPNSAASEKTLYDVLCEMWRAKAFMVLCGGVMAVLAFAFLSLNSEFYQAQAIIAPANPMGYIPQGNGHMQSGTPEQQHGVLQNEAVFLQFEHVYNGASVAAVLLKDQAVLDGLARDGRVYTMLWNAQTLSEYLKKRVSLEPVSGTALRRMTYFHPDDDFAKTMLTRIHAITDGIIRARLLGHVNQRIAYLNTALGQTRNPEHKRSLALLLMEQERLKMMLSLDQPYAAAMVEPPFSSSKPRWPDPYVIYPVFIAVGFLLGFSIHGFRRRR